MTDFRIARPTTRRAKTLTADMWPAFTTHTDQDVIIAGLSIDRLVEWCGTPCVHTADAAVPGSGGRPSDSQLASVAVARVISAEWRSDLRLHVVIDANLSGCTPTVAEARLLGRSSDAPPASVVLECAVSAAAGYATYLPADIGTGDLVVIPCAGVTLLHDIKVSRRAAQGTPA